MATEDTASRYKPAELLYEYDREKGFDYGLFLRLVVPTVYDYLDDPDFGEDSDFSDVVLDDEIADMFYRMGIRDLDGHTDFVLFRAMTYVDAEVSVFTKDHRGREQEQICTFPWDVMGTLIICPRGIRIET